MQIKIDVRNVFRQMTDSISLLVIVLVVRFEHIRAISASSAIRGHGTSTTTSEFGGLQNISRSRVFHNKGTGPTQVPSVVPRGSLYLYPSSVNHHHEFGGLQNISRSRVFLNKGTGPTQVPSVVSRGSLYLHLCASLRVEVCVA